MYKVRIRAITYGLILLFIMMASWSFPARAALLAAPTRTPTRTTSNFTLTPTPWIQELYQSLVCGLGGPGDFMGSWEDVCFDEKQNPHAGNTTKVTAFYTRSKSEYVVLCLNGFPSDWQIKVALKSPDGQTTSALFQKGAKDYDNYYFVEQASPALGHYSVGKMRIEKNGLVTAQIIVWRPINISIGKWMVTASSGKKTAKVTMSLGFPQGEPRADWVYSQPTMFGRPPFYLPMVGASCQKVSPGQTRPLLYTNLRPGQPVTFITYKWKSRFTFDYVSDYSTVADTTGKVNVDFSAAPQNGAEVYAIAALHRFDNPSSEVYENLSCIQVKWKPCPLAPDSGLSASSRVQVNPMNPVFVNVRSGSGVKNKVLDKFVPGEYASITSGPQCADNMVWWKIRTDSGLEGWTSEGQGSEVWIVP